MSKISQSTFAHILVDIDISKALHGNVDLVVEE